MILQLPCYSGLTLPRHTHYPSFAPVHIWSVTPLYTLLGKAYEGSHFKGRLCVNLRAYYKVRSKVVSKLLTPQLWCLSRQTITYFEKATKIWKNLPLCLTLLSNFKKSRTFFNFVAFSKYLSFKEKEAGKNFSEVNRNFNGSDP